jgi:hypothetical protein
VNEEYIRCMRLAAKSTLWAYRDGFRTNGNHVDRTIVRKLRRLGWLSRRPQTECTVEGADITETGISRLAAYEQQASLFEKMKTAD